MAGCNQGNKEDMPCHKMKNMWKQWSEKCKAEGKPTPCDMMKGYMKKMGCVNEDGSPNPGMMMKKMMGHHQEMMAKMSQNWENADGNPEQFMQGMMNSSNDMMGQMFPEPSAPAPELNVSAPPAVIRG